MASHLSPSFSDEYKDAMSLTAWRFLQADNDLPFKLPCSAPPVSEEPGQELVPSMHILMHLKYSVRVVLKMVVAKHLMHSSIWHL